MLATHPVGYLRFLISIAALGLLAALLLLPAPVRAQTRRPSSRHYSRRMWTGRP